MQRIHAAWAGFTQAALNPAVPWLRTAHHRGADAVQVACQQVLAGRNAAQIGHMLAL